MRNFFSPPLVFTNSAPSTETICSGFHRSSSYCPPAAPDTSSVSASRDGFQDSETTRKPRLRAPNGGSVELKLNPESFLDEFATHSARHKRESEPSRAGRQHSFPGETVWDGRSVLLRSLALADSRQERIQLRNLRRRSGLFRELALQPSCDTENLAQLSRRGHCRSRRSSNPRGYVAQT